MKQFLKDFEASHKLATEITGVTDKLAFRYLSRFNGNGAFIPSHKYPAIDDNPIFSTFVTVNLDALGTMLADRAEGPLVFVELPDPQVPRREWITSPT
ncbi:hypothetical protein AB5I39_09690 [Sphingomonas sp. MMS24-J45]|uniref:hypothetical protein n=1 Tax=Sphingomonas sp. MMS24-J45 TaxID=3238806 RepID=UPI00384F6238